MIYLNIYSYNYTANCLNFDVYFQIHVLVRGMFPGFPVTYGLRPPCLKGKVRQRRLPKTTTIEMVGDVQITAGCRQRQRVRRFDMFREMKVSGNDGKISSCFPVIVSINSWVFQCLELSLD